MKDEIRYKLKIKRKYFQGVRREQADIAIAEEFLNVFSVYQSFFIYNSFSTEASTKLIIDELLSLGKEIYLPRVEGADIVAAPYGKTRSGAFGIQEPTGQAYFGSIDVAVIPLLAVNLRGYRLGYGKGYYDRFLKGKNIRKVGLGYFFQIEDFKEEEFDERLDSFVCERGIYYFDRT